MAGRIIILFFLLAGLVILWLIALLPSSEKSLIDGVDKAAEKAAPVSERAHDGCVITGCSGEVCADKEVITACIFLPKYACYREAVCGRRESGECGWILDDKLNFCLKQYE